MPLSERYRDKVILHHEARVKQLVSDVKRLGIFQYRIAPRLNGEGISHYNVEVWNGTKFVTILHDEQNKLMDDICKFIVTHELETLPKGQRG